jgi:hypothetical protein
VEDPSRNTLDRVLAAAKLLQPHGANVLLLMVRIVLQKAHSTASIPLLLSSLSVFLICMRVRLPAHHALQN